MTKITLNTLKSVGLLLVLLTPSVSLAEVNVQSDAQKADGTFHVDPPKLSDYQSERRTEDTKKYIDPILQRGVDISTLEIDAMKRRITALDERVDKLTKSLNEVILILNEMNSEGKGK